MSFCSSFCEAVRTSEWRRWLPACTQHDNFKPGAAGSGVSFFPGNPHPHPFLFRVLTSPWQPRAVVASASQRSHHAVPVPRPLLCSFPWEAGAAHLRALRALAATCHECCDSTRAAVPKPRHPASAQEHLKAPLPRHTWRRALVLTALVLESTSPALRSLSAYLPEPMPCTYS